MPSVSERQRRLMGADLARKRAGKKTRTGMSERQLREFASSVKSNPSHYRPGAPVHKGNPTIKRFHA